MDNRRIAMSIASMGIGDEFPVRIMGVLNVSPESFYQGSVVAGTDIAERAASMIDAGADMLDLGARSTAPKSPVIDVDEERNRMRKALRRLLDGWDPGPVLLSIDTQYRVVAQEAHAALDARGLADRFVLNDVSCLTADPGLAAWAGEVGCPVIIMAAHERPGDSLGIEQTLEDLERGIHRLAAVGADRRVIVDPAIGRWTAEKRAGYDCEIIRGLEHFRRLGRPILAGISRKSFVGEILDRPDPADRLTGTLAATAVAVYNGAHVVRTHDVTRETADTIAVASAIRRREPQK